MLLVIRSRVWLPRILNAPRDEPSHYVGDFLIGHGLARNVSAPIRRSQVRAARDDDRAQTLIADERKKRIIGDSTCLLTTVTTRAMARLAVGFISGFTALGVPP